MSGLGPLRVRPIASQPEPASPSPRGTKGFPAASVPWARPAPLAGGRRCPGGEPGGWIRRDAGARLRPAGRLLALASGRSCPLGGGVRRLATAPAEGDLAHGRRRRGRLFPGRCRRPGVRGRRGPVPWGGAPLRPGPVHREDRLVLLSFALLPERVLAGRGRPYGLRWLRGLAGAGVRYHFRRRPL